MARPTLSRSTIAILALVCAVVLFVAVNVLADRTLRTTRIDLTDGHLYTLSKGSLDTLSKLDEPITLRFYYSPRLGDEVPSLGIYAQRVREMLEEYAALARGKIDLQILNPEPFSPVEDRAVADAPAVVAAVAAAEERLGRAGRILVRPSGTEPLVRVMVEAADRATTEAVAEGVAAAIRRAATDGQTET